MTQEELARLHDDAELELKKIPGVIGVGYGFKEVAGEITKQLAFTVYVVEKKDRATLRPEEIIPPTFKGIPTDVLKISKITELHCQDMAHHSPLIGGISISTMRQAPNGEWPTGTLGCFATINGMGPPENVVLLTNNHVLMNSGEHVGDTVYQPKFVEAGGVVSVVSNDNQRNPIGKIHNAGLKGNHPYQYPGESSRPYGLDCATAKLDISISSWCNTNCGVSFKNEIRGLNIDGNSAIADVARVQQTDLSPTSDYVVYKVGRTTSRTVGKVIRVAEPLDDGRLNVIEIQATRNNCNGVMEFLNQGDSGSVLVNSQNKVVGLLFAVDTSDPRIGFACHIHPVLDKLGITLITAANPHTAADTFIDTPGVITEGAFNHTPLLREKFRRTERGREIFDLLKVHRMEAVNLVNHRRPVTVAWHRSNGPKFLSHLINNARDPEHAVPREIEGVDRQTLVRNMAHILTMHGSAELKKAIHQHFDQVLGHIHEFDNLHALVEQLNDHWQRKCPAVGRENGETAITPSSRCP